MIQFSCWSALCLNECAQRCALLSSLRCPIMSGWSWRQTGRKWHTWRIKSEKLWPRTWPSESARKFADSTYSEISQPDGMTGKAHARPRAYSQQCRGLKKSYFSLWFPWQLIRAFPVSMAMTSKRETEINSPNRTVGESRASACEETEQFNCPRTCVLCWNKLFYWRFCELISLTMGCHVWCALSKGQVESGSQTCLHTQGEKVSQVIIVTVQMLLNLLDFWCSWMYHAGASNVQVHLLSWYSPTEDFGLPWKLPSLIIGLNAATLSACFWFIFCLPVVIFNTEESRTSGQPSFGNCPSWD